MCLPCCTPAPLADSFSCWEKQKPSAKQLHSALSLAPALHAGRGPARCLALAPVSDGGPCLHRPLPVPTSHFSGMISVGACSLDQVKVHVMRSCSGVELSAVGSSEGPNKTTWTTDTLEVFSWQCCSTARKQHQVSYPENKSNDVASLPWKELMA